MLPRRDLLKGGPMALFGLGRPMPSRTPYPSRPQQQGLAPGQTLFRRANTVIVFGPSGTPVGVFIYRPGTTPGPGNPPVISLTENLFDPFGNAVPGGIVIFDSNPARSDLIQLIPGSPPVINIFTGDAAQSAPGQIISGIVGSGPTRRLAAELLAPQVSGQGSATCGVLVQSPSVDLTIAPLANLFTGDGSNNSSSFASQGGTATITSTNGVATSTVTATPGSVAVASALTTVSGQLTATGGTAASPTKVTTDVAQTTANANGWTGTLQFGLLADNMVWFDGQLTAPVGVANPSSVNTAVAAIYRPTATRQLSAVEDPGGAHLGQALICQMQASGVIQVFDATAGDSVRIFGSYPLY